MFSGLECVAWWCVLVFYSGVEVGLGVVFWGGCGV